MKWLESRTLWGSLLILGGVLFLLQNLGFLNLGNRFWVIVLGLGGLFFLGFFIRMGRTQHREPFDTGWQRDGTGHSRTRALNRFHDIVGGLVNDTVVVCFKSYFNSFFRHI